MRLELLRNFSTESWSGDAIEHYKMKKEQILQIRKKTHDANVLVWIDEYVEALNCNIQRSLDFEEEDF